MVAKMGSGDRKQKLEHVETATLIPYARNARTHSEQQVSQIAGSIQEFGFCNPVLIDSENGIIAGHGRVMAAQKLGLETVPCIRLSHLTDAQKRAYILADNRIALNSGWDEAMLANELSDLHSDEFDMGLMGFDAEELSKLLEIDFSTEEPTGDIIEDEVPEPPAEPVTKPGDLWILGRHRLLCGDSTKADDVSRLMDGQKAQLVHADPPYGMGKECDGVENDNLYREKLDAFQMLWWRAFRPHVNDNGSAYIWGNAADLWRLWYVGGLEASELLELRNEIVWDKSSIAGMASPLMMQYPIATERCLFFQIGNQFRGSVNKDDFPETWEELRKYMEEQAKAARLTKDSLAELCGCQMWSHWFTRSQFVLIPQKHYNKLQQAFCGHFLKDWMELKRKWDIVKSGPTSEIQKSRSYFDNAHETMYDVWKFPRVTGEERRGHATPKPVAMIARAIKSSTSTGGLTAEPFLGSGTTLIAAEQLNRQCYGMEISPAYCDVIVNRWEALTGLKATLETA